MPSATNWTAVSESPFSHEREALDFVRQGFPSHEPYRAWSNFSFVALDGSINELDVLVFSRMGFFFAEIYWSGSRPILFGATTISAH